MASSWRFFFIVEALLLVFAGWQTLNNSGLLFVLVLGIISLWFASKRKPGSKLRTIQLVFGIIAVFISLANNFALWLMLIFAVLFIGLKGVEFTGTDFGKNTFWRKKQMMFVETEQVHSHSGERTKQQLFGNQRIGNEVYEWDDINIVTIAGDTIVDLGNTLLPKDDNIIIIRKAVGRTRVLVPLGVAFSIEHAGFMGHVTCEDEFFTIKNERLKVYSKDYDENPRRLKIITSTLLGDIEVIRV